MILDCGHKAVIIGRYLIAGQFEFDYLGYCPECQDEWQAKGYCCECGNPEAPHIDEFEPLPFDANEPVVLRFCAACWKRMHVPPRCDKCGRFMAYSHAANWGFCEKCLDKITPDWRDPYPGLHCIICGAESGNTDMCVSCAARELKQEWH